MPLPIDRVANSTKSVHNRRPNRRPDTVVCVIEGDFASLKRRGDGQLRSHFLVFGRVRLRTLVFERDNECTPMKLAQANSQQMRKGLISERKETRPGARGDGTTKCDGEFSLNDRQMVSK